MKGGCRLCRRGEKLHRGAEKTPGGGPIPAGDGVEVLRGPPQIFRGRGLALLEAGAWGPGVVKNCLAVLKKRLEAVPFWRGSV